MQQPPQHQPGRSRAEHRRRGDIVAAAGHRSQPGAGSAPDHIEQPGVEDQIVIELDLGGEQRAGKGAHPQTCQRASEHPNAEAIPPQRGPKVPGAQGGQPQTSPGRDQRGVANECLVTRPQLEVGPGQRSNPHAGQGAQGDPNALGLAASAAIVWVRDQQAKAEPGGHAVHPRQGSEVDRAEVDPAGPSADRRADRSHREAGHQRAIQVAIAEAVGGPVS